MSKFWGCIVIGGLAENAYVTRRFFAIDIHFRLKNSSNKDTVSFIQNVCQNSLISQGHTYGPGKKNVP